MSSALVMPRSRHLLHFKVCCMTACSVSFSMTQLPSGAKTFQDRSSLFGSKRLHPVCSPAVCQRMFASRRSPAFGTPVQAGRVLEMRSVQPGAPAVQLCTMSCAGCVPGLFAAVFLQSCNQVKCICACSIDEFATDSIMPIRGKSLLRFAGLWFSFFHFHLFSSCPLPHYWIGLVGPHVPSFHSDAFIFPLPPFYAGALALFNRFFPQLVLFRIYLESCRVGEATNPGPIDWHFAVINPTAVSGKTPRLLQLGDTVAISETSATTSVQFAEHPEARNSTVHDGFRGKALGVGLLSRHPCRTSRDDLPLAWDQTCRLLEAYVQIGAITIRIFVVYGFQRHDARTSLLLEMVWQRMAINSTPTIVAGDFNVPLSSLPSAKPFFDHGFQEAGSWHYRVSGAQLPPTCNGTTNNDTFLCDPKLLPFLRHVQVDSNQAFGCHSPMIAQFRLPTNQILRTCFRLPKNFAALDISKDILDEVYQNRRLEFEMPSSQIQDQDEATQALQDWATLLEHSVDQTLQAQFTSDPSMFPIKHLPKAHRGRCTQRSMIQTPISMPIKKGRVGDFEPSSESTSMNFRKQVKQARRIRSLYQLVSKYEQSQPSHVALQIDREWDAILAASGYPPDFITWARNWPEIGFLPLHRPSSVLLHDLAQIVEYDANAVGCQDMIDRKAIRAYRQTLDEKEAYCRTTFQKVRGPGKPPITKLLVKCAHSATLLRSRQKGFFRARLTKADEFNLCCTTYLQHLPIQNASLQADVLTFQCPGSTTVPAAFTLVQTREIIDAAELHQQFATYWSQFWERDHPSTQEDPEAWRTFEALLNQMPAPPDMCNLDMLDVASWQAGVKRLKSRTAQGTCGFHAVHCLISPALLPVSQKAGLIGSWSAEFPSLPKLTSLKVAIVLSDGSCRCYPRN